METLKKRLAECVDQERHETLVKKYQEEKKNNEELRLRLEESEASRVGMEAKQVELELLQSQGMQARTLETKVQDGQIREICT